MRLGEAAGSEVSQREVVVGSYVARRKGVTESRDRLGFDCRQLHGGDVARHWSKWPALQSGDAQRPGSNSSLAFHLCFLRKPPKMGRPTNPPMGKDKK